MQGRNVEYDTDMWDTDRSTKERHALTPCSPSPCSRAAGADTTCIGSLKSIRDELLYLPHPIVSLKTLGCHRHHSADHDPSPQTSPLSCHLEGMGFEESYLLGLHPYYDAAKRQGISSFGIAWNGAEQCKGLVEEME
jgi:hypothetical protein